MLWLHYCFASAFFRQVGFVKSLNSNPAEQITHYSTGPNWIQLHFSKLVQAVYALHACVSAHGDMNEVTTVVFCHKSHDTWIALSFDYVPARAPREGATLLPLPLPRQLPLLPRVAAQAILGLPAPHQTCAHSFRAPVSQGAPHSLDRRGHHRGGGEKYVESARQSQPAGRQPAEGCDRIRVDPKGLGAEGFHHGPRYEPNR